MIDENDLVSTKKYSKLLQKDLLIQVEHMLDHLNRNLIILKECDAR